MNEWKITIDDAELMKRIFGSLDSNIRLVFNNASLAAKIAKALV